jgi:hypothetical protein
VSGLPCSLQSISFLSQTPCSVRSLLSSSGFAAYLSLIPDGVQRITSISQRVTV